MSESKQIELDIPQRGNTSKPEGRLITRKEYVYDRKILLEFLTRLVVAFEEDSMELEELLKDLRTLEGRLNDGL